jgi:hypothetical protein
MSMARLSLSSSRPVRPSSTATRRKEIPHTPLAQQMIEDMQLAGMDERTQEFYLRTVCCKFAQWLNMSPQLATENDLRRYLLLIKNDQPNSGTCPTRKGTQGPPGATYPPDPPCAACPLDHPSPSPLTVALRRTQ